MAKLKVLLVDDDLDLLDVIGSRIGTWGTEVVLAVNGLEALDKLKLEKPDIVILDYMMPQMSGVAVLKEIRKIDKKIPVVMFTAHPDVKSIEGTEKMGILAYIPKLSVYSDAQGALKAVMGAAAKQLKKDDLK